MKKLIYKIAVLFMVVSLLSCEKGLMNFDNEKVDIYFYDAGKPAISTAYYTLYDSLYVSLTYNPKPDSVRKVVVSVTGIAVDHDREYRVAVNPISTATAGVHYEALPQRFVIKKNTTRDTIKVKLFRTPEMQTQTFFVKLDLLANENFGNDFKSRLIGGDKSISTISTAISFNDIVRQPKYWLTNAFGTFSRKKLFFISDFLGIDGQYMESAREVGELNSYGKMIKRELDRLAAVGTPVYEADGVTRMTMGPGSI